MLMRMLRSTEWGQLLDFVSPSFFEVLGARDLAGAVKDLLASTRDRKGFDAVASAVGERLESRALPMRIASRSATRSPAAAAPQAPAARGQLVLQLYFEQLLREPAALLDLRGGSFASGTDGLVWTPTPGFVRWDPAFLSGVRRLYRGFYAGDDDAFHAGLDALGLTPAADLFLRHFGDGDQTAVRFEMAHFTKSFHDVFVCCRDHRVRLHPNFVPLGVHLAALYEHLEGLGVPLDVRASFALAAQESAVDRVV